MPKSGVMSEDEANARAANSAPLAAECDVVRRTPLGRVICNQTLDLVQ